MKKISMFVVFLFALGGIVPSVVQAQKPAAGNSCPCKPSSIHRTHAKPHAKTPVVSASAPVTATATAVVPQSQGENQIALILAYTAKTQTMTEARTTELMLLTAKNLDAHLPIDQEDADTRKFVAQTDADLGDRLVTVEELNQEANASYLKQHAKAEGRFATAAVIDSTLGNFLRAGAEVGGAYLGRTQIGATNVTSNGGAGATATITGSGNASSSSASKSDSASSSSASSSSASQSDAAASSSAASQPQP